jgi:hypothetical protein
MLPTRDRKFGRVSYGGHLVVGLLPVAIAAIAPAMSAAADLTAPDTVAVSIDASKPGATIDPTARHSRMRTSGGEFTGATAGTG